VLAISQAGQASGQGRPREPGGYELGGLDEVEEFLTGVRRGTAPDTVLATVLCTEVVQAGAHAVWLGDRRWTELVHRHHELVRQALNRYGGREVEAGDRGVVAVFDGTARAIRCAIAVRDELLKLGLRIRAAIHAGECEVASGRPRGLAFRLTAAFTAAAQLGEVLVSSTVKDLVVGSGIEFAERGSREVEGVPGAWRLFAAGPAAPRQEDHPPPSPATALSRRESEVARLLASGLSNKEIASRLYLSERTVDNHVHNILAKLSFGSRVQVASWLARNEHTRLSTR
jgi:DNA-binding CsgD family transcriptional regulator/class 3 adenylate cyclase